MKKEDKEIEGIKKFRKKFYNEHANDYDNKWWDEENALEVIYIP